MSVCYWRVTVVGLATHYRYRQVKSIDRTKLIPSQQSTEGSPACLLLFAACSSWPLWRVSAGAREVASASMTCSATSPMCPIMRYSQLWLHWFRFVLSVAPQVHSHAANPLTFIAPALPQLLQRSPSRSV